MQHVRPDILPIGDDVTPGRIHDGPWHQKVVAHILEIGVAVAWGITGLNYLLDRRSGIRSTIGESLPNYDIWWSACYVLAALMIVAGIFKRTQRVRVAGLILLASGLIMQGIASLAVTPLEIRDFMYFVYATVALIHAYTGFRDAIPKGAARDTG